MRYDVVIMGGGTSALFASLKLKEAGVSVAVISGSRPSASLGCGEIFFGSPAARTELEEPFRAKLEQVFPLYRKKPGTYMNLNGTLFEALYVPFSALEISGLPEGLALVSLPGIHDALMETCILGTIKARAKEARLVQVRLQASIEEFYLSPVQWATRMDNSRFRIEILQRMIFQLKGSDASAFLFPPLLGLEQHEAFVGMLSTELEAPVYELMGVPGWPPGLRAGLLVESALEGAGVEIIRQRARTVERKAGGDIEGVVTTGGETVLGRFFVLATGGICGGGLSFENDLVEPVCNLPVFFDGKRVPAGDSSRTMPPERFWNADFAGNDPVLMAGVRTDDEGRPLNEYGRPVSYNLRACGAVVGRSEGDALRPVDPGRSSLMGWRVAERLVKAL
jgi:anaerobic glycerol-3-phosphate dehydrogenase